MAASVIVIAVTFLSVFASSDARQFPDFLDALMRTQLVNHTWKGLERMLYATSYQQWLESINENTTLQQFNRSNTATPSTECMWSLYVWGSSLKRKEMWAIQSQ